MSELRIGVSGWKYESWRGDFYPKGLVQSRELEFISRKMNSVEINGSFYSLQRPASYARWASETPEDFLFSVKGSKYISHMKKLADVRTPLANFFASGVLVLGKKLGPILWQLPPWLQYDRDRMSHFLGLLPRTSAAASKLALEHTLKKKDWIATDAVAKTRIRYAFEPRHQSFFTADCVELFRKHKAALVFADTADKWPYIEDVTTDFIYIRLHGRDELYAGGYDDEQLESWAKRIRSWRSGAEPRDAKRIAKRMGSKKAPRDVFGYFDNSITNHAPFDAISLASRF
jgi:uncharacterized protein YecE (DUF72 family)